jgi:hypothetical protein
LDLDEVLQLDVTDRVTRLAEAGRRVLENGGVSGILADDRDRLSTCLTDLVELGSGTGKDRLVLGELLGNLGDPRLRVPTDTDYFSSVKTKEGSIMVARHMVTNQEFQSFVEAGAYQDRALWDDDGWAAIQSEGGTWASRVEGKAGSPLLVGNQPVVGVTWYEAIAYARAHDSRLARFDERMWAVRGAEKRPYPWGSPFGEGNSNTQEEVLGRPCAVGLYIQDRTPEGVCDLAGNAAEWCADGVGGEYWVHPGAWDQPSMAAWAKARILEPPTTRNAGLGFRLAKQ